MQPRASRALNAHACCKFRCKSEAQAQSFNLIITVAEARNVWPEKFLWIHPTLSWFHELH